MYSKIISNSKCILKSHQTQYLTNTVNNFIKFITEINSK
jgi:hypothetical protein